MLTLATARTLLTPVTRVSELLDYCEECEPYQVTQYRTRNGIPVGIRPPITTRNDADLKSSAKVNNATDLNVTGLKWFKVHRFGPPWKVRD